MGPAVSQKLTAARARLILDHPFLGALALRLPIEPGDPAWCRTTATNAKTIYVNETYLADLSVAEVEFLLAHEAMHCALGHFHRRQHRNRARWDLACDLAINPLLIEEGLKPPPGALALEEFKGMAAEEIYPCLEENEEQETLDDHLYDSDAGESGEQESPASGSGRGSDAEPDPQSGGPESRRRPPPLTGPERERLAAQWKQHLAAAAQQARQAGRLSEQMARYVDHLIQPRLPWRLLLSRFLSGLAQEDYSYARPSRREGEAILPTLRSHHLNLVAVLDTSGSIDDEELAGFASELNAIKGQLSARITLHACDRQLAPAGPWRYELWDPLELPTGLTGGGGTSFRPPFEWLDGWDTPPDAVIYFTDAQGEFPTEAPDYPVLWLVKGHGTVPWGERIQLN
ncbi:MAG: VWA-like domain-containing protein [Gammaproteobacteria bacterium]